ncbi:MAG: GNAT family N-acetyltransferase, partial [Noviherbaspirillum sp.]
FSTPAFAIQKSWSRKRMNPDKLVATIYEDEIPAFVETALEHLYANVFSSLSFLEIYGPAGGGLSTYVTQKNGRPNAVFLFRRTGNKLRVFNEGVRIDATEVDRFAGHMFARFPDIGSISFNAVRTGSLRLSHPSRKFDCSEDIVVTLPATVDDYLATLGKSSRKNIKRYLGKLTRDFPGLRQQVFVRDEVKEQDIRDILAFNHARMSAKNKTSAYDEEETQRVIRLVRLRGFVSILTIDGKLCAGEICTQVGGNYFAHAGGHDSLYGDYRLGTLSCYLAISECIRRGGSEFHLLWGQYEYKYMLAGVQQDLSHLTIYRSRAHAWMNSRTTLQLAVNACLRRLKSAAQKKPGAQALLHLLHNLRNMKRLMSGSMTR